jgi:hypothetical protein
MIEEYADAARIENRRQIMLSKYFRDCRRITILDIDSVDVDRADSAGEYWLSVRVPEDDVIDDHLLPSDI